MKLKRGDAVEIYWIDAVSGGGWGAPYKEGALVRNVGIFVHQNKNGLCLARGLDQDIYDQDSVLAPAFIPKGMVKKIKRLR